MAIIYTIGHSNTPIQKLIDLLTAYSIEVVIDVRSEPYSKYATQFNKREIEPELRKHGFDYIFLGNKLGGKPKSPGFLNAHGIPDYEKVAESPLFKAGIEEVERLAEKKIALMCSEADPKACHRDRLLAWVLRGRGHMVNHILHDGTIATEDQGALL